MTRLDENTKYGEKRKKATLLIMIVLFLGILGLLLLTAFSGNMGKGMKGFGKSITGFVSFSGNSLENISQKGVYIHSSLSPKEIKLDQKIDRIEILKRKESFVNIGSLSSKGKKIVFSGFEGEISFSGENILKLKGKSKNVLLDGSPPLTSSSGKTVKVSLEGQPSYKKLKVSDVVIKELDYETSGRITIGSQNTKIGIKNNKVSMEDFKGDITLKEGELILDGYVKKVTKEGKPTITVSS